VLTLHKKGRHYDVAHSLVDHHHNMSQKERAAYDVAMKKLRPHVPNYLRAQGHYRVGDHIPSWVVNNDEKAKGRMMDGFRGMDTETKVAHGVHTHETWEKLRGRNGEIDEDGHLTVYRRPTEQDTERGFKGRKTGETQAAKDHDWGGSSWSLNPWHVGRERDHRPGLKARVHHSQVLAHPLMFDMHKRIGGFQRENEVILKPGAKVSPEPCGGDPRHHSHLDDCHDKDPKEVERLQRDATYGRYPGSKPPQS
jgi:hypothetical protein